ncbi:MAG: Ig-like domain-containing protein [Bacteroidota bacterium]
MKKICKIIIVLFLFGSKLIEAQSTLPGFQWTKRDGEGQYDYGYGIATDSVGNVYVAGKFEMDANFGGNTWVKCAGNHDIFVAKYDPLGNFLWVRTAGGVWGDYSRAVSCDAGGNVYVTGEIEMNCEFFGSGIILYSHGDNDIFVCKYNTNGDMQWAKKLGGGPKSDRGYGITYTNDGVYIAGNFQETCVFNENITITPKGAYDIFVAKYSLNGDFQWIRTAGGTGNDEGWAISSDPAGNVYATGYFSGSANFSGTNISSSGGADIFIAKYNSAGTLLWVTKAGGSGNDYGRGITVDKLSRIYITGGFRSRCDFGSIRLTAVSSNDDIFIASYNSSGTPVWARRAGGSYGDIGKAITVDPSYNVTITGYFAGTATFGNTNITGIDGSEIYVASYDASGNFKWVLKATGVSDAQSSGGLSESGLSIAADKWNNVFASGCYRSNSTFGTTTLTAWDHTDIFTTKIGITNTKPKATIITPTAGTIYRAGNTINFSGNGTDVQDGNLPASAYSWKVELQNGTQFISGPSIPSGVKNGSFIIPTTGEASGNVFYRLTLVVKDIQGLKDTTFVDINPRISTLGLISQPAGLQLLLDGQPRTTPYSVSAVSGMTRVLGVTTPQTLNGISYVFDHWLQGGNASQNIIVTDSNKTYTAIFNASGAGNSCTSSGTISRDLWANFTGLITELPVNTTPTSTTQLTLFEGPSQAGDNYGSRIRGYICPPATGNYTFWIASDNKSELWLSTNDQPANKVKIAYASSYTLSREWTKYPTQQSNPISLIEGTKYYIEAIHKEATEGDNLAVGWQLPNGVFERPIPGTRLSPFGISLALNINQPINNTSFSAGSPISIQATPSGGTGTVQKVEFFAGTTKLGEDLTSPYSFTWNNATVGNYALTAKTKDSGNNTAISTAININVTDPLTATISSPLNNNFFIVGSAIALKATTSGGTGTIQKVEFFDGTTKLAEVLTSPYDFTWSTATAGLHSLKAKATDSGNNSVVSTIINITLINALTASITSPANNSSFNAGAAVPIQAIASGGTGTIQKVEFFVDTIKIGEDLTRPYNFTWNNAIAGNHLLWAKATDSVNNSASSAIINISINNALSASIVSPANNSSFNVGSAIVIQAAASGGTGTIQKVEFFADTIKLGEDLTSPYSYTWNTATAGNYALTAKATNSGNNVAVSAPVNITVNTTNELTSIIISPLNNTSFNLGAAITIQAIASGGTGSIKKVEFFADTTKLGELVTSPYNFTWNNGAPGSYVLKAKATDSINNSVFSLPVNIIINKPNPPSVNITSPVIGTRFSNPANISINANALSSGGSITKVEFFQDTIKIGEDLTAPYNYTWMNVTSGNYIFKAKATDNYSQSTTSQAVNITVANCTTPVITPLGSLTTCSDSVTLKTNTDPGNLYQWIKNGTTITGATNSTYMASATGNYQVKIIQGSCISWSAPVSVKIQSGLSASITPGGPTTFCEGGDLKLFANTCTGYTYQWKKDNVAITGATSSVYTAVSSGVYQIKITLAGISAWSAMTTVTVNPCRESETNPNDPNQVQTISDIPVSKNGFQMKVFPNPNTGLFTIALNMPLIKEEKVQMKVVNIVGQEVYSKVFMTKDNYIKEIVELDKSLPTGVYTLQVLIGNNVENTIVILSK